MSEVTLEQIYEAAAEMGDSMEGMNQKMASLGQRIGDMETVMGRPGFGGLDEPRDEKYRAFFEYLRRGHDRMQPDRVAVMTVGDDTTGGYLAPSEYVTEIIRGIIEFSPLRSIARVRETSNAAVKIPKRTGAFAAQWTKETGTRSETTGLTYGLEEIPSHELYALVDISSQDLEDSAFNIEAELNMEFSEQFGVAEGTGFVLGNGVTRPEGFLENADVGETNSGDANLITADGLIDLFHAVKTGHAVLGTWTLNRATLGEVRKLKDGNGQYLWQSGIAGSSPNTILGQPYVEMTDMPVIAANANPVAFGNFRRGYMIVDRIQIEVLRDPLTQATAGNIRFIARRRVGGQVVLAEAIRKLKIAA